MRLYLPRLYRLPVPVPVPPADSPAFRQNTRQSWQAFPASGRDPASESLSFRSRKCPVFMYLSSRASSTSRATPLYLLKKSRFFTLLARSLRVRGFLSKATWQMKSKSSTSVMFWSAFISSRSIPRSWSKSRICSFFSCARPLPDKVIQRSILAHGCSPWCSPQCFPAAAACRWHHTPILSCG